MTKHQFYQLQIVKNMKTCCQKQLRFYKNFVALYEQLREEGMEQEEAHNVAAESWLAEVEGDEVVEEEVEQLR